MPGLLFLCFRPLKLFYLIISKLAFFTKNSFDYSCTESILVYLCFINDIMIQQATMKTITSNSYAKVIFNGSATYMVVDTAGQCLFSTSSKVKALNRFAKISKDANVTE